MNCSSVSALITNNGDKVLLRLDGRFYELNVHELRQMLDLPEGPLAWESQ